MNFKSWIKHRILLQVQCKAFNIDFSSVVGNTILTLGLFELGYTIFSSCLG